MFALLLAVIKKLSSNSKRKKKEHALFLANVVLDVVIDYARESRSTLQRNRRERGEFKNVITTVMNKYILYFFFYLQPMQEEVSGNFHFFERNINVRKRTCHSSCRGVKISLVFIILLMRTSCNSLFFDMNTHDIIHWAIKISRIDRMITIIR